MVEAAIVFPLAIAAVMAVIYIMTGLYSIAALQAHVHVALRAEAGERSALTESRLTDGQARDRYRRAAESRALSIGFHKAVLRPYVFAEEEGVYAANSMVSGTVARKSSGRVYLIDEAKAVRDASLLKGLFGDGDGG
jgi:hypothetical protein